MFRRIVIIPALPALLAALATPASAESDNRAAHHSGIGHAGAELSRRLGVRRVLTVDGGYDGPVPGWNP